MNYNAFGITALQRLSTESKAQNVFLSPVSIGVALAMASDGAKGQTREEILETLGMAAGRADDVNSALTTELSQNTDAQVGIANALWTREDVKPRPEYVELLRRNYGAQAQALHFGDPAAAQAINAWTKAHTLGLIDKIVENTHATDFMYLTNALSFKAKWSSPFKAGSTKPMPFTNADGSKSTVQMMSQIGPFQTFDGQGFSALRMPYGHGGYAAYVLLPASNDVDALVKTLNARELDNVAHGASGGFVEVQMPRFTARYGTSLVPLLKAMGMAIAFTPRADFSGIHAIPPAIRIDSVQHMSYVQVDEEGTTAAAATSVGFERLAMPRVEKRFIVNHPFVLALRDEHTGTLLFIGVIRDLKG